MYSIETLTNGAWKTRYYLIIGYSIAQRVESELICSGQLARIVEVV